MRSGTKLVFCNHCGHFVDKLNFVGLCWVCAKYEIPLRTQIWAWIVERFKGDRD